MTPKEKAAFQKGKMVAYGHAHRMVEAMLRTGPKKTDLLHNLTVFYEESLEQQTIEEGEQ